MGFYLSCLFVGEVYCIITQRTAAIRKRDTNEIKIVIQTNRRRGGSAADRNGEYGCINLKIAVGMCADARPRKAASKTASDNPATPAGSAHLR